MLVAIVLIVFSVVVLDAVRTAGSSLTVFAERNTNRDFGSLGKCQRLWTQIHCNDAVLSCC